MIKKYVLTNETKIIRGHILYRIQSLIDFNDVKKGDLGGYIESEDNLSQEGNCWVYDEACVYNYAKVYEDAEIRNNVRVYDNAKVHGSSHIIWRAKVYENAEIYDEVLVFEHAKIYGNACIYGDACIYYYAKIYGNAKVYGHSEIRDYVKVYDNAEVFGDADIIYNVKAYKNAKVYDNQFIKYGTITKDILKEKDWERALKCLYEDLEINNNELIYYTPIKKTRNKNIFFPENFDKSWILRNNEVIYSCGKKFNIYTRELANNPEYYALCNINLNDVSKIDSYNIHCEKFKVLNIIKHIDIKVINSYIRFCN